jgi:TonB family protein
MNTAPTGFTGKVASVGIPTATVVRAPVAAKAVLASTQPEVSIPKPTYTDEARHLRIQGNVVLRVTFFASGQIQVLGVLQGLGHGLDEQARTAVQQGRVLRPAMRNSWRNIGIARKTHSCSQPREAGTVQAARGRLGKDSLGA